MKKGLKITVIAIAVLLLLMFILPFAFRGKLETIVKTEGNKMLNATFDFRTLDISLFRNFPKASVTLSEFYLCGTGEFKSDTLIRAGEIIADLDLFSLFGGDAYDISKVQITNASFHAIILDDGHTNWNVMKPDSTAKLTSETESNKDVSPFKIRLQRFVIKNMNLTYDDRQTNMYVALNNFNALCSGDLGSDRTTLQLEAEAAALTYKLNGIPLLTQANIYTKMDVDADLNNNKYTLKENEFRLNAIKASVDGWISLKDPSALDMDLRLNTSEVGFKEILSLIPAIYTKDFDGLKADGTVNLTAKVLGTLTGDSIVPQFDVAVAVKDGMFRYPSLPAGVDQININAEIKNPGGSIDLTSIDIRPFSFRLAGNPFSLVAEVKTPVRDPDFHAEAKGILNLGMIKQVYPLEDTQLNGTIHANMQLSGRFSYIEKEEYDRIEAAGTIGLSNMQLKIKDIPDINIRKSLFTFTPKYLQLSETTVSIGKNDLTADSRFENYLGYALKGTTLQGILNIRSSHLNLNEFMTVATDSAGTPETATDPNITTDTEVSSSGLIKIPRNIDFRLDARLKEVLFDKMSFTNMNGQLTIKDGKVDMNNLSMNTMGGSVVMNGYYSTTNPEVPRMDAGFRLSDISFVQAYKDLNMVQQFAPVFENLKGNFSGYIDIQTNLDATMSPVLQTMQGSGSLSTRDLSLSGVKAIDQIAEAVKKPELKEMRVKDMKLDFTIKEGRVATQPFDIKLGEYRMNLSGSTGLDKTIDYTGKIKLPASAGDLAKLTTLDLKIGGSFTSPKVSIDTQSMANQAIESIADKAVNELGKKLGLDSVATANKDSLKEKATEKALDFLKKKLK